MQTRPVPINKVSVDTMKRLGEVINYIILESVNLAAREQNIFMRPIKMRLKTSTTE